MKKAAFSKHRSAPGFTLVEILVVLVLFAMIGGILFQALERSYWLQQRFGVALFGAQHAQMSADWLRQSVHGLQPEERGGAHPFAGTASGFSGLTSNPLGPNDGATEFIQWTLRREVETNTSVLIYSENDVDTEIGRWPGTQAHWVYLDADRQAHDQWPPALGQFPQIPSQVHLLTSLSGPADAIIASTLGPTQPQPRPGSALGITP